MRPTLEVNKILDYTPLTRNIFIDPVDMFTGDSTEYSDNRLVLGAMLSQSVYNENGDENSGEYIRDSLLNLGFSNIEWKDNTDPHGVAVCFGNKIVLRNSIPYNVIAVVVRGTSEKEWIGNFNVTGDYEDLHNDFAKCCNDVSNKLTKYISTLEIGSTANSYPKKIFVCGHSRAGAVVDLLAHSLNNSYGQKNVYAYTYAAPNSTKTPSADKNIFNYIYKYDFVPFVPHGDYKKHGINIVVGDRNEDTAPESVAAAFEDFTGGNTYKSVGGQLLIQFLLASDEIKELYPFITTFQDFIGKKILDAGISDNYIAKAHGAENYLAWAKENGRLNEMTLEEYEDIQKNKIATRLLSVGARAIETNIQADVRARLNRRNNPFLRKVFGDALPFLPVTFPEKVSIIGIDCPVDTELLDLNGNVLVSFSNHQIITSSPNILAFGDGVADYLFIPEDIQYTLKLSGNDEGTMTVGYAFFSDGTNCEEATAIIDIPVHSGEEYYYSGTVAEGNLPSLTSSAGIVYDTEYSLSKTPDSFIIIPNGTKSIGSEALCGISAETVYIPNTLEIIESKAFANCPNLRLIIFENGNIDVAEDFVTGCPLDLMFEAPEGSTVANNVALYLSHTGVKPDQPGHIDNDDCPEEPETDRRPDILVEDVPHGAGDEEGGFAGFE